MMEEGRCGGRWQRRKEEAEKGWWKGGVEVELRVANGSGGCLSVSV